MDFKGLKRISRIRKMDFKGLKHISRIRKMDFKGLKRISRIRKMDFKGLKTSVSLHDRTRLNTLKSNPHRINVTLLIKSHPVNTSSPMLRGGLLQRTAMINDIIVLRSGNTPDRMMAGASRHLCVLLQDLADTLEWAKRRIRYGISDTIIGTCPATLT